MKPLSLAIISLILTLQSPAFAEQIENASEPAAEPGATSIEGAQREFSVEPERVYVETDERTYRSTRSSENEYRYDDERCFYNEDHEHIHCFSEEIEDEVTDRVYVNNSHRYIRTRHSRHNYYYDPISTGIAVGLAVGIPLLIHDSHRSRSSYNRHNRHRSYNRHNRHHSYNRSSHRSHRGRH